MFKNFEIGSFVMLVKLFNYDVKTVMPLSVELDKLVDYINEFDWELDRAIGLLFDHFLIPYSDKIPLEYINKIVEYFKEEVIATE